MSEPNILNTFIQDVTSKIQPIRFGLFQPDGNIISSNFSPEMNQLFYKIINKNNSMPVDFHIKNKFEGKYLSEEESSTY